MRWLVPPVDPDAIANLSRELGFSPLLARLLVRRGIRDPETAQRFLRPSLDQIPDPFLMADMPAAVERLRRAIDRNEKVLIYGDYDVDGTLAVVVLLTALRSLGAKVEAHIPDRFAEGYGMRIPVIERAASENVRVIISVDTGVREHEVIKRACELGIDCIVTDHHLPESHLPPAKAILNPRRPDCSYPDKNLSGVGVAWKLVQAMLGERLSERQVLSYLKVVAIGTVADVVPLLGENRIIAHFGLRALAEPEQPGLGALLEVAGVCGRPVSTGEIGFRIAPRINAAGRMENARDVIDLFMTREASRAREIAQKLEALNRERQSVEDEILRQIEAQLRQSPQRVQKYSLVISGDGWHRGVIGIVAQRVVDRYHRPALVIGVEDGVGVGSGRSIRGFHLLDALAAMSDLFDRYGGHAQAAGFTLPSGRIEELETRFENCARSNLTPEDLEPILHIDAELDLAGVDWSGFEDVERLEPFGCGNAAPVFLARGLSVALPPRILQEKHLKLKVGQAGKLFDALGWGRAEQGSRVSCGQCLDMVFTLDQNVYRGVATLQLVMKDFRVQGA